MFQPKGVKRPQHLGMSESDRDDFQEGLGDRGQCPRAQAEAAEWLGVGWGSVPTYTPLHRHTRERKNPKSGLKVFIA